LEAIFWVLAHEPQQSIVITHISTAMKYDWITTMKVS
jgi:hypothetical protein